MSFLTALQAQPWYSDVQNIFASDAPDVPTELWEGELLSEDSSLNPAQQDYLNSGHYGLFQENAAFPTSVGLPEASVAQLQNPDYNAYVAALRMEQALKATGATTYSTQVQALEEAGWPGAISSGETATRLANVNQIVQQEGGSTSQGVGWGGDWWNPLDPKAWGGGNSTTDKIGAGVGNAEGALSNLGQQILVGGILVAFLAGGFALLAASVSQGQPMPVPV